MAMGDLRLRLLDLRIALARRAEGLGLVVALDAAAAAVDLRRRVAQRERLGVVAQMQRLEVENVPHALRQSRVRPDERHVTLKKNNLKNNLKNTSICSITLFI